MYIVLFADRASNLTSNLPAMPIIFSLLGDIYTAKERAIVSSLVSLSIGLGIAAGQLLAGLVGPTYGWRVPFVIVSVPAIILTIISWWVIEEPERVRLPPMPR